MICFKAWSAIIGFTGCSKSKCSKSKCPTSFIRHIDRLDFEFLCILEGFNNITCVLGMACSYWCKLGGIFLATGTLLSRLCHWQVAGKLWVVGGRQKPLLQLETVFCAEYPNFLTRNRCRKPNVKGEHGSPAPGNLFSGLAQKMGLAWQPLSAVFLFSGSAAKRRET